MTENSFIPSYYAPSSNAPPAFEESSPPPTFLLPSPSPSPAVPPYHFDPFSSKPPTPLITKNAHKPSFIQVPPIPQMDSTTTTTANNDFIDEDPLMRGDFVQCQSGAALDKRGYVLDVHQDGGVVVCITHHTSDSGCWLPTGMDPLRRTILDGIEPPTSSFVRVTARRDSLRLLDSAQFALEDEAESSLCVPVVLNGNGNRGMMAVSPYSSSSSSLIGGSGGGHTGSVYTDPDPNSSEFDAATLLMNSAGMMLIDSSSSSSAISATSVSTTRGRGSGGGGGRRGGPRGGRPRRKRSDEDDDLDEPAFEPSPRSAASISKQSDHRPAPTRSSARLKSRETEDIVMPKPPVAPAMTMTTRSSRTPSPPPPLPRSYQKEVSAPFVPSPISPLNVLASSVSGSSSGLTAAKRGPGRPPKHQQHHNPQITPPLSPTISPISSNLGNPSPPPISANATPVSLVLTPTILNSAAAHSPIDIPASATTPLMMSQSQTSTTPTNSTNTTTIVHHKKKWLSKIVEDNSNSNALPPSQLQPTIAQPPPQKSVEVPHSPAPPPQLPPLEKPQQQRINRIFPSPPISIRSLPPQTFSLSPLGIPPDSLFPPKGGSKITTATEGRRAAKKDKEKEISKNNKQKSENSSSHNKDTIVRKSKVVVVEAPPPTEKQSQPPAATVAKKVSKGRKRRTQLESLLGNVSMKQLAVMLDNPNQRGTRASPSSSEPSSQVVSTPPHAHAAQDKGSNLGGAKKLLEKKNVVIVKRKTGKATTAETEKEKKKGYGETTEISTQSESDAKKKKTVNKEQRIPKELLRLLKSSDMSSAPLPPRRHSTTPTTTTTNTTPSLLSTTSKIVTRRSRSLTSKDTAIAIPAIPMTQKASRGGARPGAGRRKSHSQSPTKQSTTTRKKRSLTHEEEVDDNVSNESGSEEKESPKKARKTSTTRVLADFPLSVSRVALNVMKMEPFSIVGVAGFESVSVAQDIANQILADSTMSVSSEPLSAPAESIETTQPTTDSIIKVETVIAQPSETPLDSVVSESFPTTETTAEQALQENPISLLPDEKMMDTVSFVAVESAAHSDEIQQGDNNVVLFGISDPPCVSDEVIPTC